MGEVKHPAQEYLEDFANDRFYGERSWNVLEQEPASLYKLERADEPTPPLRLWGSEVLESRAESTHVSPMNHRRTNAAFLPLALGALAGGLMAARFGGVVLAPFGAIAGMLLASNLSRRG